MRIYDMRCKHPLCGRVFDWHTKVDIYENSRKDDFRDVRCWFCGRLGAKRAYTSAPADITPKGTWGRTASPELKGKSYYGKKERDRQTGSSGSVVADSGEDRGTLSKNKDGTPQQRRDKAREAIELVLIEQGEMQLKDIISSTGLTSNAFYDVIYKDPGRIQKAGRGTYRVSGV